MKALSRVSVDPSWLQGDEASFLAFLMTNRNGVEQFLGRVTPEVFSVPHHRLIYGAILDLHDERENINIVTISARLSEKGKLVECGDRAGITNFAAVTTSVEIAESALDAMLDAYCKRAALRIFQDGVAGKITPVQAREKLDVILVESATNDLPEPTSLIALAEKDPAIFEADNLLGIRWLCREGGALIIAPSGIGKSSFGIQQDICFALGRSAFGIEPPRPLRILTIQAENDDGDLAEMSRGICAHLNLTNEERRQIADRVVYIKEKSLTGSVFLRLVRRLAAKYRPDIIRIDPLHAYAGGDVRDPDVTTAFLRNGLNPILQDFRCAAIIMHHTPKTIYRDTSEWSSSDWMYAGAGNADLTNWARAILVIDATHVPGTFVFRAAKRGSRIGWADEHGEPVYERLFCHQTGGAIFWRDAADDDAERVALTKQKKPPKTVQDLLPLVPLDGSIGKNVLRSQAQINGIGNNRFRDLLAEALESTDGEPMLYEWRIPRPRTNPEVRISRYEQTLV